MNLVPTASTTAALALGDALAMTLLVGQGISAARTFANLHPGGRLGKRLMRVEQLMHAGDQIPRVSPGTPMPDVHLRDVAQAARHDLRHGRTRRAGRHHHRRRPAASHESRAHLLDRTAIGRHDRESGHHCPDRCSRQTRSTCSSSARSPRSSSWMAAGTSRACCTCTTSGETEMILDRRPAFGVSAATSHAAANPRMRRIALTGGIATGKSHVLAHLPAPACPHSTPTASPIAAVAVGSAGLAAVVTRFGASVLAPRRRTLDRRAWRALVFTDAQAPTRPRSDRAAASSAERDRSLADDQHGRAGIPSSSSRFRCSTRSGATGLRRGHRHRRVRRSAATTPDGTSSR